MTQPLQIKIKTSIIDKERLLIIDGNFLEYNGINLSKLQISELRYGIKAIKGYRFRIGRIYCIDIKGITGEIIKIRLKSLYRIRKTRLEEKYKLILQALFDNYFNDISTDFIQKFNNKIDFIILGVKFSQDGLSLDSNSGIIPWLDLGSKNYWTYYSLFSNANPKKYKTFQYLFDWNTIILLRVSRYILKSKNLL